MLPTTSHSISKLTENVPISAQEAGVWTRFMKKTIAAKIKMTKLTMTVLTLKKLYSKSLGTDCVEKFLKNECSERDSKERIKLQHWNNVILAFLAPGAPEAQRRKVL